MHFGRSCLSLGASWTDPWNGQVSDPRQIGSVGVMDPELLVPHRNVFYLLFIPLPIVLLTPDHLVQDSNTCCVTQISDSTDLTYFHLAWKSSFPPRARSWLGASETLNDHAFNFCSAGAILWTTAVHLSVLR